MQENIFLLTTVFYFYFRKKKQNTLITIFLIHINDEWNHYNLHDYVQFQLHRIEFVPLKKKFLYKNF